MNLFNYLCCCIGIHDYRQTGRFRSADKMCFSEVKCQHCNEFGHMKLMHRMKEVKSFQQNYHKKTEDGELVVDSRYHCASGYECQSCGDRELRRVGDYKKGGHMKINPVNWQLMLDWTNKTKPKE